MLNELKPPIILFGNTRSGTTIVQKVMCEHPDLVDWYEPCSLWLYADPGRKHDEFNENDATDKVKRYIRKRFLKYQKQNGNRIVVEKTPRNILKIPYVRAIFPEAIYLYLVREPFSFISSVELKWQSPLSKRGIGRWLRTTPGTQLYFYAGQFIDRFVRKNILKKQYISIWGPRYNGILQDLKTLDMLTVVARQWAVGSRKAEQYLLRFAPGQVLRLKYEDYVTNPVAETERICTFCGLEMIPAMRRAATEWVRSDLQDEWKRFEPQELVPIVPEIYDEMRRHGYELPVEIAAEMEKLLTPAF